VGEIGIGFLFAPLYHSAMRHAAKARMEVGLRSIFNMLGPLTNPAGANCQLIGVYAPELTEMFAQTLRLLGSRQAYVVHGHDGLDEISICAPTRVSELKDGQVRTFNLDPSAYFGEFAHADDLAGGNPETNAAITTAILIGEKGPRRNVVLLNAAAALVAAGAAADIEDGLNLARTAIDKGAAKAKLDELAAFTQDNAPSA
jgi:anthranilate phosphoribosyltransferase